MLTLEMLKECIENNTLDENLIIIEAKDESAKFVAHQYLHRFIEDRGLEVNHIETVEELPVKRTTLFGSSIDKGVVNLFTTSSIDKLPNIDEDALIWIIADKVKGDCIKIPKLEDWHYMDYAKSMCPNEKESDLTELVGAYKGNIYRLHNELEKIKLCNYNSIKDQLYTDVTEYSLFDISNAILQHDMKKLWRVYNDLEKIDVDAFSLAGLLRKGFKNVIDIQLGNNPSAEKLGISSKQFWAIKKFNVGKYSNEKLVENYKVLLDIDRMLKMGEIDTQLILDYLILKII